MTTRLFFLMMLPLFLSASTPATIDFYKGNLSKAKEIASREGKLYFVQFTASWCEPCRWMDEVTYTDPSVVAYVEENYIPVKVDIDDFDGFAYKQMYNIRMLPSVLVFSTEGELLKKYEESLPPTTMLKILKSHNTPENRTAPTSYQPVESSPVDESNMAHTPMKENISRPALKPSIPAAPDVEARPAAIDKSSSDNDEVEEDDGHYRFKVANQPTSGFSVQIGIYSEYANVMQKADKVQDKFEEQMIVYVDRVNEKTVYKIMVGEFPDREAAEEYKNQLKAKGVDGIVKDLSLMK